MLQKLVGYAALGSFLVGTFLLFFTSHGLLSALLSMPMPILILVNHWRSERAGLLGRPFDRDYVSLFHRSTRA